MIVYTCRLETQFVSHCCGNYVLGCFSQASMFNDRLIDGYFQKCRASGLIVFTDKSTDQEILNMITKNVLSFMRRMFGLSIEHNKKNNFIENGVLLQANVSLQETPARFRDFFNNSTAWREVSTFTNFKTNHIVKQYHTVIEVE